jgi:hypothetical protein
MVVIKMLERDLQEVGRLAGPRHVLYGAFDFIRERVPNLPDSFDFEKAKDRARSYYVSVTASIADQLFLERVCCMAIQDVVNRGQQIFRLSFPHIDNSTREKIRD